MTERTKLLELRWRDHGSAAIRASDEAEQIKQRPMPTEGMAAEMGLKSVESAIHALGATIALSGLPDDWWPSGKPRDSVRY